MRYALVPHNLDMSLFGDKADKIAMILNCLYRKNVYTDSNGIRVKRDFSKGIPLNMKRLREVLGENAPPLMDMICVTKRHKDNGTEPIEEVLKQVKLLVKGKSAAHYVFTKPYRVKPFIYILKGTSPTKFKHDKEKMDAEIAGWPKNYRTVCEHIEKLTLELNEEDHLIDFIRIDLWKEDRDKFIERMNPILAKRHPELSRDQMIDKAKTLWERQSKKRIARLDEKHYFSLQFIEMKILEMQGENEFPIYKLDKQGRLHYYLTNMSEDMRPYIRLDGCKVVSYDLGTSQCVFVWITLREYIRKNNITLDEIKKQADEIIETIKQCGDGTIPAYVQEGFAKLKRKRSIKTLDNEMKQLGKLLSKDFYDDIMQTIGYQFGRKRFKTEVLFPFLYGQKPSWNNTRTKKGVRKECKTMMQYFLKKFPSIYCVLWKMPCDLLTLTHFMRSAILWLSRECVEQQGIGFQETCHGRFEKLLLSE